MKKMLCALAYRILKRYSATIQWPDLTKVPGLFAPEWSAARYNFATGLIEVRAQRSEAETKALGPSEWVAFNFSHPCPGNPGCPD